MKAKLERQALERIAAKIVEIVTAEGTPPWRLVFPQTILPALLKSLPATARKPSPEI